MKSLKRIGARPASLPLSADDILEFHAARLLLLLRICGTSNRIDGLTKMAKLDFFARYPDFFEVAKQSIDASSDRPSQPIREQEALESAMVRHHYGPWDKRYYHVLAYLESNCLVSISKREKTFRIALTDLGVGRANALTERSSFNPIVVRMRDIKRTFGSKSGTALKTLIYRLFDEEVGQRPRGEVI